MNKKNGKKIIKTKAEALPWLVRAIWSLAVATLIGIIFGGVLLLHINKMSGWNAQNGQVGQLAETYSKNQIDKFITSVLIAIQNQPLGQEGAQADMVFIASFNAFEQKLTIAVLSHEIMVEVEQHGKKALGEAYAIGGPNLLMNTLNRSFDLDLQYYVCTDTHSLAAMIDLLGGIQVELTPGEANYITEAMGENVKSLQAGPATLTGVQSMVYALDNLSKNRLLGGLGRSSTLIHSAVFNMRKTATKEAMLPLLSLIFSSIQTNLDFSTLRDCGYEILKAEEIEYRSLILPCNDSWKTDWVKREEFPEDILADGTLLHEALYSAGS